MLTVKKISFPCNNPPLRLAEKMMDSAGVAFCNLSNNNWDREFPYSPDVKFRIAWSSEEIFIQFIVKEEHIRAVYTQDSGSLPYKDSCVEFFMIPPGSDNYYNLEMNCIGIGTFACGPERNERTRFGADVLSKIRRISSLGSEAIELKSGGIEWKLTIAVPLILYGIQSYHLLLNKEVRANFYKCGDELPMKHYLSWSAVKSEKPDFHTPQFFGRLLFKA